MYLAYFSEFLVILASIIYCWSKNRFLKSASFTNSNEEQACLDIEVTVINQKVFSRHYEFVKYNLYFFTKKSLAKFMPFFEKYYLCEIGHSEYSPNGISKRRFVWSERHKTNLRPWAVLPTISQKRHSEYLLH